MTLEGIPSEQSLIRESSPLVQLRPAGPEPSGTDPAGDSIAVISATPARPGGRPELPPRTSPDSAQTRPNAFRELGIGLLVFACYLAVDLLRPNRADAARVHGDQLWRLERHLHLDVELRANAWLNLHHVLRTLFNYEYGTTYIVAAFGLLVWLWWRHPRDYRQARSSFVLLNLIAIATFWLYPVMPPRMLQGFIDTVTDGHTVGSWGSPLVSHANQLAAMPSLHVGWALWVSMVLARLSGGFRTQLFSGLHVALTCWVVVATANHYVLDAVGAAVAVAICAIAIPADEHQRHWHGYGQAVPAADAFFLHIESPRYPQQVGGVVPLDVTRRPEGAPSQAEAIELIRSQLPHLPRFRQRLSGPTADMSRWARWRRPRWVDIDPDALDWSWHVPVHDVRRPDGSYPGLAGLDGVVAKVAGTQLPMDRPLWQFHVVHGIGPATAAIIFVVHHVIADGIGTVAQAMHILEPPVPEPAGLSPARPGRLKRAVAIVAGTAQLAADGSAGKLGLLMDEGHDLYPGPDDALAVTRDDAAPDDAAPDDALPRAFGRVEVSLDAVKRAAKASNARLSDLLLAAVAGGLAGLDLPGPGLPDRLRVAVPLMVREPSEQAEGNVTAAVMIDLPTGPMPAADRLRAIAPVSGRLRSGSRALASRFVMAQVAGLMPTPLHRRFARTVYGPRTFHAVVSNMPGPSIPLTLAQADVISSYPLLPLAPGTPLTVGTLGWNGALCLAFTAGGWLQPHADELVASIYGSLREMGVDVGDATPPLTVPGTPVTG